MVSRADVFMVSGPFSKAQVDVAIGAGCWRSRYKEAGSGERMWNGTWLHPSALHSLLRLQIQHVICVYMRCDLPHASHPFADLFRLVAIPRTMSLSNASNAVFIKTPLHLELPIEVALSIFRELRTFTAAVSLAKAARCFHTTWEAFFIEISDQILRAYIPCYNTATTLLEINGAALDDKGRLCTQPGVVEMLCCHRNVQQAVHACIKWLQIYQVKRMSTVLIVYLSSY